MRDTWSDATSVSVKKLLYIALSLKGGEVSRGFLFQVYDKSVSVNNRLPFEDRYNTQIPWPIGSGSTSVLKWRARFFKYSLNKRLNTTRLLDANARTTLCEERVCITNVWHHVWIMAKTKQKHPVRSIRISDETFEKLSKKKKRGESWEKFLKEHYVEGK